jgi:hypothetical protein
MNTFRVLVGAGPPPPGGGGPTPGLAGWGGGCCQVEVSATDWSLVQGNPTDCGASCVWSRKPPEWGGHSPRWTAAPHEKKNQSLHENDGVQWRHFLLFSNTIQMRPYFVYVKWCYIEHNRVSSKSDVNFQVALKRNRAKRNLPVQLSSIRLLFRYDVTLRVYPVTE